MDTSEQDFIKQREIVFCDLHPNPQQAQTATLFLAEVEGVLRVAPLSPNLLEVQYDLLQVTLKQIEDALEEIGLHLDSSLLFRIRRALHHYTEDTQRQNMGCKQGESNCTRRVFALRYQILNHGCRDDRPEYWRRYL